MADLPQAVQIDPIRSPHRWWVYCWWLSVALVWLVAIVHGTVRDAIVGLSLLFYAVPRVLQGLFALLLAWIGRRRLGRISRTVNRATAALGIFCLGCWGLVDFRHRQPQPSTDAAKVLLWNVGRGHFADWDHIARQVGDIDADVIALLEVTAIDVQTAEFWKSHLPNHAAYPMPAGMVLLVKGHAREVAAGSLAGRGEFCHLSIDVHNQQFDVLIADIRSDPMRSRERPINSLFKLMQNQGAIPTLVVGDFNTPPTSVWFDQWRSHWTRAWDVAGSGYQSTWPQPFPALALDQIWGNEVINFQSCHCEWSRCSDHRPVIAWMRINDTKRIEVPREGNIPRRTALPALDTQD